MAKRAMPPTRITELLEMQQRIQDSPPSNLHRILCSHMPEALHAARELNEWLEWFRAEVALKGDKEGDELDNVKTRWRFMRNASAVQATERIELEKQLRIKTQLLKAQTGKADL